MAALGSHAEAEDAAQDAFVLAWRRLDGFRGDASFRTWLLTIAWHQAINRRRSVMGWWKRMVPLEEEGRVRLTSLRQGYGGPPKLQRRRNTNPTYAAYGEIGTGAADFTAAFASSGVEAAARPVAAGRPDAAPIDRR